MDTYSNLDIVARLRERRIKCVKMKLEWFFLMTIKKQQNEVYRLVCQESRGTEVLETFVEAVKVASTCFCVATWLWVKRHGARVGD